MLDQFPDVIALPASALLVEPAAPEREKLRTLLLELGVESVVPVDCGAAAARSLAAAPVDLVVMAWEVVDLPGLALFNRIKATPGYAAVPILVTSKLLHKKDFELLREYPCCRHIAKPLARKEVEAAFFGVMAERAWYTANSGYVDVLLRLVDTDPKAVVQELRQLLADAPEPTAVSLLIARALIEHGFVQAAQALLERLAATAARSPAVLWQLARVHYLGGRPREARQLLDTAERLTAGNLERLCLQGEVSLALHDPGQAQASFARCLAIDGDYPRAKAGQVLAGNLEAYVRQYASERLPRTLAATANMLGVHLAQNGEVAEGIAQYQAALTFLGEGADASRIAFNLGLGHLRNQELPEALDWFRRAETLAGGTYPKAQRYRAQTEQALRSGKTVAPVGLDLDLMDERIGDAAPSQRALGGAAAVEADLVTLAAEIDGTRKQRA